MEEGNRTYPREVSGWPSEGLGEFWWGHDAKNMSGKGVSLFWGIVMMIQVLGMMC